MKRLGKLVGIGVTSSLALLLPACGDQEASTHGIGDGDLLARFAEMARKAEAAETGVLLGREPDVLFGAELRHLGVGAFWGDKAMTASRAEKAERRDPLPAILDFDAQMRAAGIEWLFVPVPAKVVVDPSVALDVAANAPRCDTFHVEFYRTLREAGVPVLDVTDDLRALVASGQRAHCATDSHWTGLACAKVAERIREHVGEPEWLTALDPASRFDVTTSDQEVEIDGDLRKLLGDPSHAKERLTLRSVRTTSGDADLVDAASPILLMGDSHTLVFHAGGDMHAKSAGLVDHLARCFRTKVDLVGVRGSGATPSRVDVRRGNRLAGKRLVIWCLTVREFTETAQGWAKVPMIP